jgi:CheY-like chemotaxis protein
MTSNLKILFIDEEKENFDRLLDYLEKTTLTNEIYFDFKLPLPTLNEMIEAILESNPDALVVDYRLNEDKREIKYNVPLYWNLGSPRF